MLADPDVEMVVIALPLWLHAPVAIQAMKAGKHVFCEKLMAHNIGQCKEMVKVAHETNKLLAIGHQRHYSALYDNANYLVQEGHLGEIRHIRALWHRNNAVPQIEKDSNGKLAYDDKGNPVYKKDKAGNVLYFDSWKKPTPEARRERRLRQVRLQEPGGAGLLAALQPHRRRPDGRTGQPPARRLLDLPGQEAPPGRHRDRRDLLLHRRPRGRRPRLRQLRVPRQGREGPHGRHLLVDQHQRLRDLRRGADGHSRGR